MAEVCDIDWHVDPVPGRPLARALAARRGPRCRAFGASSWSLTRSIDDPLAFRQSARSGRAARTSSATGTRTRSRPPASAIIDLYDKPLLPTWHTLLVAE